MFHWIGRAGINAARHRKEQVGRSVGLEVCSTMFYGKTWRRSWPARRLPADETQRQAVTPREHRPFPLASSAAERWRVETSPLGPPLVQLAFIAI